MGSTAAAAATRVSKGINRVLCSWIGRNVSQSIYSPLTYFSQVKLKGTPPTNKSLQRNAREGWEVYAVAGCFRLKARGLTIPKRTREAGAEVPACPPNCKEAKAIFFVHFWPAPASRNSRPATSAFGESSYASNFPCPATRKLLSCLAHVSHGNSPLSR